MVIKIARQEALDRYPIFPIRGYDKEKDKVTFSYPPICNSYVLTLPSKSFKGHIKILGEELTKLAKQLSWNTLLFLGDTELSWLYQDNDYNPVKQAQQYLADKKVGKRFNGALKIDAIELTIFIQHLAWLTRCNALLPYFYFIDAEQNIIGNICKYGNLHIDTLNEQIDKDFIAAINNTSFIKLDGNSCYNQFGKTGAIAGRQIKM